MKELKDYLHLYYGCDCVFKNKGDKAWKNGSVGTIALQRALTIPGYFLKLILRPLSDMTEEEAELLDVKRLWKDVRIGFSQWDELSVSPEQIKKLLSKSFDLFGLIPSGLAIDSTTIKTAKP